MNSSTIRSPFFYVGDKYKLMPQLKLLFPQKISTYVEPFVGGGSSFLNTEANKYVVNDIDYYVIALHKYISSYSGRKDELFDRLYHTIDMYGLSCSFRGITVPDELKKRYKKTYYSHFNKEAYSLMKRDYNDNNDMLMLYLLLVYGFNHMIRFNREGLFNLPVGNVDFNSNVYKALCDYLNFMENSRVEFFNMDYREFVKKIELDENSFIYLDPPYLISGSEYNKHWDEAEETKLCAFLEELQLNGIRFGVTNLVNHKGKINEKFLNWSRKYNTYSVNSNYISFNDNTIKEDSKEIYVTNYGPK